MKIDTTVTDNISEILDMIVEFTNRRQHQLSENIVNVNTKGYVPKDLDESGFSKLMGQALSEHLINDRLILTDSPTIRFGADGCFKAIPVIDNESEDLLASDKKQYLKVQLKKMAQNHLNRKTAVGMIRQKLQNFIRLNA